MTIITRRQLDRMVDAPHPSRRPSCRARPGRPDLRQSPYGPASHLLGGVWFACAGAALALAVAAEAARLAVGWWAWHGPRLAIETAGGTGGE